MNQRDIFDNINSSDNLFRSNRHVNSPATSSLESISRVGVSGHPAGQYSTSHCPIFTAGTTVPAGTFVAVLPHHRQTISLPILSSIRDLGSSLSACSFLRVKVGVSYILRNKNCIRAVLAAMQKLPHVLLCFDKRTY